MVVVSWFVIGGMVGDAAEGPGPAAVFFATVAGLVTGILVGLIISLLQTLTQLQDQTFSIVPKIVAMFGAAIFFVPWLANRLLEYAQAMFAGGFRATW